VPAASSAALIKAVMTGKEKNEKVFDVSYKGSKMNINEANMFDINLRHDKGKPR